MPATPAEPSASRPPAIPRIHVAIASFCLALLAIIWGATLMHVREERSRDVAEAERRNANIAMALEEQTIRTLKGTNQALSFVKHEFERTGSRPVIQELVDRGALDDSLFDRIEIADDQGHIAPEADRTRAVSVADQDFFKALRRQPTSALYIGRPARENSPDRWTIRLARRLDKSNGAFAGVVFAAVNTAYFTRLYRRDDLGDLGLITLVGVDDGIVRATRVGEKTTFGQDVRTSRLLAEQARSPIGGFVSTDKAEGVERFYSYRTLREYPFVVAVGTSIEETLAPFNDHAWDYYLFAGLASALVALIAAGSMVAISQKRKAFETLARSELRYREIFTHTKDGIVVLDVAPDGRYRFADINRAFSELSGFANDDVCGKLVGEAIPAANADSLIPDIDRCIDRGTSVSTSKDVDFPAGHRNLWITFVPIRDNAGAIRRVMAVIRDRTETHRAASALRTADASNRAKNAYLAKMSHELRSPLNGVLGMFELLARTPLDRDQVMMLEVVQQSARSLLRSVEDVLDFSRIDSGEIDLNPEVTSIPKLVASIAGIYAASASGRGLTLTHFADERMSPALVADALRLRQVLSNLVGNAVKFTRQGRVELRAEVVERDGGYETIRFCVSDTGIGISEEDRKQLFQPFAQAEASQRSGRTGLGLSICQRLAALMNGTVTVASAPGRGTTVTLTLRLKVADPGLLPHTATVHALARRDVEVAGPAPAEPATPPPRKAPLLLVDDHPVDRLVLMRQVNMLGYSAEQAESAGTALEMWRAGRFAMVITSCDMAQVDGLELTRRIRALEREEGGARTAIIGIGAHADAFAGRLVEAGMDDCLAEPVEFGKLEKVLKHWLAPAAAPVAVHPIDEAVLAEISAGDGVLARDILLRFHRYNAEDTTLLNGAVRRADAGQVTYASHRIKEASKTVGATALAAVCEHLERACRANDWEAVALHMDDYRDEISRLDTFIESFET